MSEQKKLPKFLHELSLLIEKVPFTISFIGGLENLQTIVHFRSPIDSKSQDLTKFKSGTLHIMRHKIYSHITYEFEVLQNSNDNNDCLRKKIISWTKFFVLQKNRKRKKSNKKAKTSRQMFLIPLLVYTLQACIHF